VAGEESPATYLNVDSLGPNSAIPLITQVIGGIAECAGDFFGKPKAASTAKTSDFSVKIEQRTRKTENQYKNSADERDKPTPLPVD
jgi:hypothetical protein